LVGWTEGRKTGEREGRIEEGRKNSLLGQVIGNRVQVNDYSTEAVA